LIVVSIAYRLGVFGFFAHPELEDANFGLLDQIAALKWLADNMQAFGGDAGNVTVMGESAGASNIAYLLASPEASGLFRRVIHQSAGWAIIGRTTREEQLLRGKELQKLLLGDAGSIEQMRAVPAEKLIQAAEKVYEGYFFDPVIDGRVLTSPVKETLLAQHFPAVDLLIGSNADEWLMYLEENQSVDDWMRENLTVSESESVRPLLPAGEDSAQNLDTLITAYNYVCPSMFLAEQVGRRGGRSWFYYFARVREGELAREMGAYHGAELPYVFNNHDAWLPTSAADLELTEAIMDYWVNFIRSGDPNGPQLQNWPLFDRKAGKVMTLDREIAPRVHQSLGICDILLPSAP
jgi:para-nitrobenzyl esterase